jgi:hypothetical protein
MNAIDTIREFQKGLRELGAAQFGTDNMDTTKACIQAITDLTEVVTAMQDEGLFDAEWPSQGKGADHG